jgi:hypothetical protein
MLENKDTPKEYQQKGKRTMCNQQKCKDLGLSTKKEEGIRQ